MDPAKLIESMQDPQMRHAAVVHLPVALTVLGVLLALLTAVLGARRRAVRATALGAYVLLLVTAFLGSQSGELAHDELGALPEAVHAIVEEHEEMGEAVWIFAAATTVLLALGLLPGKRVAVTCGWLAVPAAIVTMGWTGVTAHHGGTLVYEHGVGTPAAGATRDDAAAPGLDAEADPRLALFRDTIRPLLEEKCVRCHAGTRRKGGLDQTSMAGLLRGGDSGVAALVPGNPDVSQIYEAVRWENDEFRMPPKEEHRLNAEQVAAIAQWIREGAVWSEP